MSLTCHSPLTATPGPIVWCWADTASPPRNPVQWLFRSPSLWSMRSGTPKRSPMGIFCPVWCSQGTGGGGRREGWQPHREGSTHPFSAPSVGKGRCSLLETEPPPKLRRAKMGMVELSDEGGSKDCGKSCYPACGVSLALYTEEGWERAGRWKYSTSLTLFFFFS